MVTFDCSKFGGGVELRSKNMIRLVPIDEVIPNPLNVYNTGGYLDLAGNISLHGLEEPLKVIRKQGTNVLLSGHTRLEALRYMISHDMTYTYNNEDITGMVPVIEVPEFKSEIDEQLAIIASNYQRVLTDLDKENLINRCLIILEDLEKEGRRPSGRTADLIGSMVHLPPFYIKNYLARRNSENSEVDNVEKEKQKKMKTVCQQLRRLYDNLQKIEWNDDNLDKTIALKLMTELKELLQERIGEVYEQ